ncbi:MAG: 4-hydroxy-tetrahydrodipicolinate synthase [Alphaproteobacteria bacterium]|nr:4-hydroxy-tetrahydrodipicolinate synthase [Alphaproteobacteria bacterium]
MFTGSTTALVTPFNENSIDETAYRNLIEWQINEGTHALAPCGTTGESPTLSHKEHKRAIDICIKTTNGRVPVIAGTGSNNTTEALELTAHAKEAGADGALIVTPYYNKPSQAGLYNHYKTINDKVDIPIIIYNIPGRSVINMSVETMKKLAELPNIVGVKDATNDLARPLQTRVAIGNDFCQLSGEDATAIAFLAQGGHGCISVTSNVAPKLCSEMHKAWQENNLEKCLKIRDTLMPLHDAMFIESNPGPVKYALNLLDKCSSFTRPPLFEISDSSKKAVKDAMKGLGLI